MIERTLAHLSDLHLGFGPDLGRITKALVQAVHDHRFDHVIVSGDLTERGRFDEYAEFEAIFAELIDAGRVTIVPGNHDRVSEDVGATFMAGAGVAVQHVPGAWIVRVDSTGAHNKSYFASHGELTHAQIRDIRVALDEAPPSCLTIVVLHHHPLPLPEESFQERLTNLLGWPHARELELGRALVESITGVCDLLLHGHRHVARSRVVLADNGRHLRVSNAGSSTESCQFDVYRHRGGRLVDEPTSITIDHPRPSPPTPLKALMTAVSTSGMQLF